ncbi:MAG: hydrogenase 3 maturation endopeptidase HyCI [Candidatus Thermoplasmatota archaeon]|nr:hydrogenase 3 maturation endopeptidase HyCI [Candidatus Thermoplasmatota archaeon]
MCIGNRDGGDDAVGPFIADALHQVTHDLVVLDCGVVPENYTSVVKRHAPEQAILIDAVDMHLPPGEIRRIPKEKIGVMHISTHGIPLSVLMNYLETFVNQVQLVGIQPATMSGEMTQTVIESAHQLIALLMKKDLTVLTIVD